MKERRIWKREIEFSLPKVIAVPRKQIYNYSQVHTLLDPGRKLNVDKTFGKRTFLYILFQGKTTHIESLHLVCIFLNKILIREMAEYSKFK